MNRTKILVSFFMVIVLVALPFSTVFAASCNHNMVNSGSAYQTYMIRSDAHIKVSVQPRTCTLCHENGPLVTILAGPDPHNIYNSKNWHSGTTHNYTYKCRVCGYSYNTSRSCSGPPCPIPG